MSIKKCLILVFIIVSNTINAQQSLNDYKYIVVPKKFDFLKGEDKYQLNSLTKFLFAKEGFQTVFDNDVRPQDLAQNQCLGLTSKVNNKSSMFTTKLVIELLDCRNQVVFTSSEGRSKQKDYKKGYQEAIRNAFESIKQLNYSYSPSQTLQITEKKVVKKENAPTEIVKEKVPVKVEKPVSTEIIKEKIPQEPKEVEVVKPSGNIIVQEKPQDLSNMLYAQQITNGYQLVDSTPKIVFIALKSNTKDLYFLKNKAGVLFKENNKWYAEYYKNDKLVKEELTLKF